MTLDEQVKTAVSALEDVKARDIVVFDVSSLTTLFDRMIIASAESTRQTKALSARLQEKFKQAGGTVHGVEGEQSGEWILCDLGDLVVHIMQPAVRDYYDLEQLWSVDSGARTRVSGA